MENIPNKTDNQTLIDYSESLTDWYIDKIPIEDRKRKGQYFTPKEVSKLMVSLFENVKQKDEIRILDPGAGLGIFESTFCEIIKSYKKRIRISFDLYENDPDIIPFLELNMQVCKENMISKGFDFSYNIFENDFILSNAPIFNDSVNFDADKDGYDYVISNPPYYKLKKDSPQVIELENIVRGQPNIYTLFMAISAKLLKNGGQMTVLTPRSYCSGLYFKTFRKWFFQIVKPKKIHLFESRKEIFKKYDVLQENVILTAIRTSEKPKKILISVCNGMPDKDEKLSIKKLPYDKIIIKTDNDIVIRIPTSDLDDLIAETIDKFENNLEKLGYKVSTGPVVPFRASEFLISELNEKYNYIPLIWMHNIENGIVKWPLERNNVPSGLKRTKESENILKPNQNYVLIKRFSTKEGKQRINAGIFLKNSLNSEYIGIENHVNFIYKKDGELTIDEAYGIAALLNSKLYNIYFQITNGSTQVNASEIRNFPFPPIEKIKKIGNLIQNSAQVDDLSQERIIIRELNINEKVANRLLID